MEIKEILCLYGRLKKIHPNPEFMRCLTHIIVIQKDVFHLRGQAVLASEFFTKMGKTNDKLKDREKDNRPSFTKFFKALNWMQQFKTEDITAKCTFKK